MASLIENMAPEYTTDGAKAGNYYMHSKLLYLCKSDCSGLFDESNFEQVYLSDLLRGTANSNLGGFNFRFSFNMNYILPAKLTLIPLFLSGYGASITGITNGTTGTQTQLYKTSGAEGSTMTTIIRDITTKGTITPVCNTGNGSYTCQPLQFDCNDIKLLSSDKTSVSVNDNYKFIVAMVHSRNDNGIANITANTDGEEVYSSYNVQGPNQGCSLVKVWSNVSYITLSMEGNNAPSYQVYGIS